MIESLYIAETGMSSQQKLIDVISNNIANVSTPGFKKSQLSFVDLVYQSSNSATGSNAVAAQQLVNNGAGVQVLSTVKDFSVGDLKQTNNPFDVAIQGAGFMEVEMKDSEVGYSRAGRLQIDIDGYLMTTEGYRLSANIQIPPDSSDMKISQDGEVTVFLSSDNERVSLGEIELVRFTNDGGVNVVGDNLFMSSEDTGNIIYAKPGELGTGQLLQGVTEVSNVSMTEEMVNLMLAQRGYQLNARIIQVSDQLLDTINNLRR